MNDYFDKSDALARLLEHPISPAPIPTLIEQGQTASRNRRRRKAIFATGTAVGAVTLAGALSIGAVRSSNDDVQADDFVDTASLIEACMSGRSSQVTFDVVSPGSSLEARKQGWPVSAEEAAQATLHAPAFSRDLGDLSLSAGIPVDQLPEGAAGVRYGAARPDGSLRAVITVQEFVPGAWATTTLVKCG